MAGTTSQAALQIFPDKQFAPKDFSNHYICLIYAFQVWESLGAFCLSVTIYYNNDGHGLVKIAISKSTTNGWKPCLIATHGLRDLLII